MALRAFIFRAVFLTLVSGVFYYVYRSFELFMDVSSQAKAASLIAVAVVFFMVLLLPFYFFSIRTEKMSATQKMFLHFSHYSMALSNFLLFVLLARDIFTYAALFLFHADVDYFFSIPAFLMTLFVPVILTLIGYINVRRGPQIVRVSLQDSRLPSSFSGLKIVQVSDLHISVFLHENFVDQTIQKVNAQNPDLIFLTGDIIDGFIDEHEKDLRKLGQLKAKHGVFYVSGNHEHYWGVESFLKILREIGITVLNNQSYELVRGSDKVLICGVPDPAAKLFQLESVDFAKLALDFKPEQYKILLSHQPKKAIEATEQQIHLQFSGHTHGGQYFPWNFLIVFFEKFYKGFYQVKSKGGHILHLYVNQGTAYWGPALRLGTFCEITECVITK